MRRTEGKVERRHTRSAGWGGARESAGAQRETGVLSRFLSWGCAALLSTRVSARASEEGRSASGMACLGALRRPHTLCAAMPLHCRVEGREESDANRLSVSAASLQQRTGSFAKHGGRRSRSRRSATAAQAQRRASKVRK